MSRKRPQVRPEQVPIPARPSEPEHLSQEPRSLRLRVKSRHLCPMKHLSLSNPLPTNLHSRPWPMCSPFSLT